MKLESCVSIHFNGNCEAALTFYERALGAKVLYKLTWGDSPMANDAPPEWRGKLLHARWTLGNTTFVGGDVKPGAYETPRGFGILLSLYDLESTERVFKLLAEKGTVALPLQETFWAHRYALVTDEFGVSWEINCERPA